MRKTQLKASNYPLSSQAFELCGFLERMRGLLGKRSLSPHEAYIFPHCRQVHSFGMKLALELVFLDESRRVLGYQTLLPGRISHAPKHTFHIIELGEVNAIRQRISVHETLSW